MSALSGTITLLLIVTLLPIRLLTVPDPNDPNVYLTPMCIGTPYHYYLCKNYKSHIHHVSLCNSSNKDLQNIPHTHFYRCDHILSCTFIMSFFACPITVTSSDHIINLTPLFLMSINH